MNAVYNVLRFKRKIASDTPLNAIVVSPKRSKPSESSGIIFKYAGIASDDASVQKTLKRALDDSKEGAIICEKSTAPDTDCSVATGCSAKESLNFTSVSVRKKRKIGSDIFLIDFDDNCLVTAKPKSVDYDLLTCNGLKMMKSKLSICTSSNYTSDGDDLYDVYYNVFQESETVVSSTYFEPLDLLYIAPYENDFLCSDDENQKNALEDSDSNDENYYTNDYPDSPGSRASSNVSRCSDFHSSYQTRIYGDVSDGSRYGEDSDNDPTDFFQRYSDHVQSDASLSD